MSRFELPVRGPYELAASARFLGGFAPSSGSAAAVGDELTLAFRLDRTFEAVAVALGQDGAKLRGEVHGTRDADAAARQVARMLSVDVDGTGYAALGAREPVLAPLLAEHHHLRPVVFPSPYEAALWGVISQRVQMRQAAEVKRRLSVEHGVVLRVGEASLPVAPAPDVLRDLDRFPGLTDEKCARLRGVAEAALDGRLDADRLRGMPPEAALAELRTLRGVGPWTAAHVLHRGAGTIDELPLGEPRLHRAAAFAYALDHVPDDAELIRIAEAWRPYRTWVAVLLVVHLARHGEWTAPDDARSRGRPRTAPSAGRRPRR